MALELVEHIETNNVWSVVIQNIPQDGTALLIKTTLRDNQSGGSPNAAAFMTFNNSGSAQYYYARSYVSYGNDGYQVQTSAVTSFPFEIAGSAMNSRSFASGYWMIENYAGNKRKNIIHRATIQNESNTTSRTNFYTANWDNTSAITSIEFIRQGTPAGGYTFLTGGTITIYKYVE